MRWFLGVLSLTVLVGCGGGRSDAAKPGPTVFDLRKFPDVPMAPGYAPDPDADQLAVSLADGAVRRMHGTFIRDARRKGPGESEIVSWYAEALAERGWEAVALDHDDGAGHWRKTRAGVSESLVLAAGSSGRSVRIRLILQPGS